MIIDLKVNGLRIYSLRLQQAVLANSLFLQIGSGYELQHSDFCQKTYYGEENMNKTKVEIALINKVNKGL